MLSGLLVRVGAIAAYVVLYRLCPRRVLAPRADYWDRFRYGSVGVVSRLLGGVLHTDRPIRDREFVGTLDVTPERAEELLWERGFHRNPIAAVKTRDGVLEIGSWALRESPTARRQLHVMLFENPESDTKVDVYAHEEFSSLNPRVAVRHYRGIDQRERLGVERARERLPFDASDTGD